jgi:hypothetical protein
MLLSLAAMPAQAQLQLELSTSLRTGLYSSPTAGQTVRILIGVPDPSTGSLSKPSGASDVIVGAGAGASGGQVKAFSGSTGALLWSRELPSLSTGLHTIDINRDDLREEGEPGTGRIQLWIEVVIDPCSASQQGAEECGVRVFPPTFEVVDNDSGRTTAHGAFRVWYQSNDDIFTSNTNYAKGIKDRSPRH